MIVVFIIVLVVFGPNKLPELARGLGKLMAEFRKASADFKGAFEQEMREIERQTVLAERKKAAEAAAASVAAEPVQAATQGTAVGAETSIVAGTTPLRADETTSAVGVSEGGGDTRATEALVVTPVAEAVARGWEEPAKVELGAGVLAEHAENTTGNGQMAAAVPTHSSGSDVVAHDSAHDTQQPA
jgi:sec-independent protein translocase protein TatB